MPLMKRCEHFSLECDIGNTSDSFSLGKLLPKWNDGAVKEADGSIAAGQAELSEFLEEAHELIAELLESLPDDE